LTTTKTFYSKKLFSLTIQHLTLGVSYG